MFYSIGVDTGRSKGERETKDFLEKDCQKRERQIFISISVGK